MKAIPVTFSPTFDLYFAESISHLASGTSPNIKGTVALTNAEVEMNMITQELQAECCKAWEEGCVDRFVRKHFFPTGRAKNAQFWGDNEC